MITTARGVRMTRCAKGRGRWCTGLSIGAVPLGAIRVPMRVDTAPDKCIGDREALAGSVVRTGPDRAKP